MELFTARFTLLILFGLLSGGAVVAVTDCESSNTTFPVRGAANQLAAAAAAAAAAGCTTHSVHVSTSGGGNAAAGLACDTPLMSSQLTHRCRVELDYPGVLCCAAVIMVVEQDNCLCTVAEAAEFDVSDLSVPQIWTWYKSCGGRRRSLPKDDDSCKPGSPPPPPPPPPAKPEAPSAWTVRLWLAVGLLCAAAIAAAVFVGLKLWLPRTVQVPMMDGQGQGARLNLGRYQDLNDAAVTGSPPVDPHPDVRPRAGEDASKATPIGGSGEEEEEQEVSPHVSPMRVKGRKQLARVRLPCPPPLEHPPPPPPRAVPPMIPSVPTPGIMAF